MSTKKWISEFHVNAFYVFSMYSKKTIFWNVYNVVEVFKMFEVSRMLCRLLECPGNLCDFLITYSTNVIVKLALQTFLRISSSSSFLVVSWLPADRVGYLVIKKIKSRHYIRAEKLLGYYLCGWIFPYRLLPSFFRWFYSRLQQTDSSLSDYSDLQCWYCLIGRKFWVNRYSRLLHSPKP